MKLGSLNSAIRAAPAVSVRFSFGPVELRKGTLIEALSEHHGRKRGAETGLTLTADGFLSWEADLSGEDDEG
jgi:hypothetical protein